jgi:hypothetical protein
MNYDLSVCSYQNGLVHTQSFPTDRFPREFIQGSEPLLAKVQELSHMMPREEGKYDHSPAFGSVSYCNVVFLPQHPLIRQKE